MTKEELGHSGEDERGMTQEKMNTITEATFKHKESLTWNEDIEKEITDYFKSRWKPDKDADLWIEGGVAFEPDKLVEFANHFAEWGKNHKESVSDDSEESDSFDKLLQELYIKQNKEVPIEKLLDIAIHFVNWYKEETRKQHLKEIRLAANHRVRIDIPPYVDLVNIARENAIEECKQHKNKELLLLKEWFEDIAEKCEHLTSGNVSHNGKMIRGFAKNCAEYIETDLL